VKLARSRVAYPWPTGLRISELLALRVKQVSKGTAILPRMYGGRQDSKGKRSGSSLVMHPKAAAAIVGVSHSDVNFHGRGDTIWQVDTARFNQVNMIDIDPVSFLDTYLSGRLIEKLGLLFPGFLLWIFFLLIPNSSF
jgi:integrase